jgi:hypothetical protein
MGDKTLLSRHSAGTYREEVLGSRIAAQSSKRA